MNVIAWLIVNRKLKAVKEIRKQEGLVLKDAIKKADALEAKWGLRSTRQLYIRDCHRIGIPYLYMKRNGIAVVEPKNLLEV